jgi:mRNA-degrading endonuclease RelE of RelBE toxin-antitoxin system
LYLIKFTDDALENVRSLPKNIRNCLKKEIREKVAQDPYGCSRELREPLKGFRTFSYENYRVIFKIYEGPKAIGIAGVGRRDATSQADVYKKLQALALEGKLAEKVLATLQGFSE